MKVGELIEILSKMDPERVAIIDALFQGERDYYGHQRVRWWT